ncbi:TetR/AcrR family transcriptional regulator [Spelaeicoccus albus]|uniref:AcrR family transcriptional regulator n=1 Tax=Spelaeicoccus albus TaxID=1280376 RepID=A0A7Z0D4T3_9MICO|nr:TetR/AcrR family transcriptional regulator [Spelaeicoccus albus]NYI68894.1 AcrR family transcriptional regulator [Spelaeicoccus albus]
MSLIDDSRDHTPKRRRGAALEAALLDAAWEELIEKGYDHFTIESVADRARTSRAVVYRRWPGKAELLLAAAARAGAQQKTAVPDTGTLRGDMIELLRQANRSRSRIGLQLMQQLGGHYAETGTGIAELRSAFLSERTSAMEGVLDRAIQRGEADPAKLTPRVIAVPFDLYRQELMMTLKEVPDEVAVSIIDEVFLPLVTKK